MDAPDGACGGVAPFLVTDKSKNAISFTISYSRTSGSFNRMQCWGFVNGKYLRIKWSCLSWDGFDSAEAKLLKLTKFSDMTSATNLVVLVDAMAAISVVGTNAAVPSPLRRD